MKFIILASGSKGNCSIVLCDNTNLIIDMGISYLTLKRSLEEKILTRLVMKIKKKYIITIQMCRDFVDNIVII